LLANARETTPGTTPELATLPGARFLLVSELRQAARLKEELIKDMTGGERVQVNPKYKEAFTFLPKFTPWLYGNHKPTVSTDRGIRRRLPLVPFTVTIPKEERIADLEARLQAEAEGILAWCVAGARAWYAEGLNCPPSVVQATRDFHEESDVIGQFLGLYTVRLHEGFCANELLRRELDQFCEAEGYKTPSPNELAGRLQHEGFARESRKIAGKTARVWVGLAIRRDAEDPKSDG